MLVVVSILSVLAVGASVLAVRSGGALPRTTDLLQTDAMAARHLAMLSGLDHALVFSGTGWEVSRRSGDGWTMLSSQRPAGVSFAFSRADWIMRPDGAVADFDLRISSNGDARDCRAATKPMLECR
nr:hypothetical protein [Roseivivax lentus]